MHSFNLKTLEAKADGSLSLKPTCSTVPRAARATQKNLSQKKTRKHVVIDGKGESELWIRDRIYEWEL